MPYVVVFLYDRPFCVNNFSHKLKNEQPTALSFHCLIGFIVFLLFALPQLLDWVSVGIFYTSGQVCSATSRVIVEDSFYDEFLEQMRRVVDILGHTIRLRNRLCEVIISFKQRLFVYISCRRPACCRQFDWAVGIASST